MSDRVMKDSIQVDLENLREKINGLRQSGMDAAFTSQIIKEYMGGFLVNKDIPVHISWNAQFGKILSKHREYLGIEELEADVPVEDDLKRATTSSKWRLR